MSKWILGLQSCREVEPGLFTGESRFDGEQGWVRVKTLADSGEIEYQVGATPDRLVSRIHARVTAGETLGYEAGTCLIILQASRPRDMDEHRWKRLVITHETEIELIRAQLEAAA